MCVVVGAFARARRQVPVDPVDRIGMHRARRRMGENAPGGPRGAKGRRFVSRQRRRQRQTGILPSIVRVRALGPDRTGSDRIGPDRTGSDRIGSPKKVYHHQYLDRDRGVSNSRDRDRSIDTNRRPGGTRVKSEGREGTRSDARGRGGRCLSFAGEGRERHERTTTMMSTRRPTHFDARTCERASGRRRRRRTGKEKRRRRTVSWPRRRRRRR